MREIAAIKHEAQEQEREIYDLAHVGQSSMASIKTKQKEVPVTIQSMPINLNAALKIKKAEDGKHKLAQIGKLVDQLRIGFNQPTQSEIDVDRNNNFKRPVTVEEPSRANAFMQRAKLAKKKNN